MAKKYETLKQFMERMIQVVEDRMIERERAMIGPVAIRKVAKTEAGIVPARGIEAGTEAETGGEFHPTLPLSPHPASLNLNQVSTLSVA